MRRSAACFIMPPSSVCWGLLLSLVLLCGCRVHLLSKEQRQMDAAVRQAVQADPSRIDAVFAEGAPPLQIAMTYHLPDLFDWLLAHGASPDARDQRGQTALHKAVIFDWPGHHSMRVLLTRGADVDARGDDGGTPLHLAAFLSSASCVEALLGAGANPNAPDGLGRTPLHLASTPQPTADPQAAVRTIHLLVAGGADASAHETNGDTPLHLAAMMGSVEAVRALLSEGAEVDARGLGGGTALHTAARFAKADVAEILLQAGADPNLRDDRGLTPLEGALQYPAVMSNAKGAGPVATDAVAGVLRRFMAMGK